MHWDRQKFLHRLSSALHSSIFRSAARRFCTTQVNFTGCDEPSYFMFDDDRWNLMELRFHSPSEHAVSFARHTASLNRHCCLPQEHILIAGSPVCYVSLRGPTLPCDSYARSVRSFCVLVWTSRRTHVVVALPCGGQA